jgi:ATP-binding protein involved in chromosome partitioning
MFTRDAALTALKAIHDPELFKDIVTLNLVKDLRLDGDGVYLQLELPSPTSPLKQSIEKDARAALKAAGAGQIDIRLSVRGQAATAPNAAATPNAGGTLLPQVKYVVAVGAGKGGVGKSTIAVNLAVGLARAGLRVGLMDGDIYGPSAPTMLGIRGEAPNMRGNKIKPFFVHGIHAITIGALVDQEKPLIWRGPMAHGAFKQLLADNTDWPELDYLIVDLPPGTGDVSLTLCQLLQITGAVVVATPQQVALDDAIRAVRMFQQLNAPLLGIIENMSYLVTPTGDTIDLFGRGGAQAAAKRMSLPFLGELPMYPELRIHSDAGTPHANFEKNKDLAAALEVICSNVIGQVNARAAVPAAPKLTIS